jgi:1-deoxy-D-xylulose-5-phosphate synthase
LEAMNDMGVETPVVRIGWPDHFIEHGKVDALRARHGVSVEAALEKLAPILQRGGLNRGAPKLVAR